MTDGLNTDQAIAQLRTLPPDRQRAILSRLDETAKVKILQKLQSAPSAAPAAPASFGLAPNPDLQTRLAAGPTYHTPDLKHRVAHMAPVIGAGVGATAAGLATGGFGAPEGAAGGASLGGFLATLGNMAPSVLGAAAGGASGSVLQQKVEKGSIDLKEEAKEAGIQAAWELGGGLVSKGLDKAVKLLGIDDAIMKFALKTGEDYERGLNPAAALNKWKLKAATTKELWEKTVQKISTLTKTSDAILKQAEPYSSTIRPYAIIKGVLDKYRSQAARSASPEIQAAMHEMTNAVEAEFGFARQQTMTQAQQMAVPSTRSAFAAATPARAASELSAHGIPTDRVMTLSEANALKNDWGKSVNWSGKQAEDKLQAVYKAEQEARRDIYQELNRQIADAMGGNEGRVWRTLNHDIFNLMEAQSLLKEAGKRHAMEGKGLVESLMNTARKPGPASMFAAGARGAASAASHVARNLPNYGRGAYVGGSLLMGGGNESPFPQPQPQNPPPSNPFLVR